MYDKTLARKIGTIMQEHWNPIGGEDIPSDEYDSYIPKIYSALQQGASKIEIAQLLSKIQETEMGLESDIQHCNIAAEKLVEL